MAARRLCLPGRRKEGGTHMSDKEMKRLDDAGLGRVSGGAQEVRKQKGGYTV